MLKFFNPKPALNAVLLNMTPTLDIVLFRTCLDLMLHPSNTWCHHKCLDAAGPSMLASLVLLSGVLRFSVHSVHWFGVIGVSQPTFHPPQAASKSSLDRWTTLKYALLLHWILYSSRMRILCYTLRIVVENSEICLIFALDFVHHRYDKYV